MEQSRSNAVIVDRRSEAKPEKCEIFLVIQHPDGARILIYKEASCHRLPCFYAQPQRKKFSFEDTAKWIPEAQRSFGFIFNVAVLRCIWYKDYEHSGTGYLFRAILVLESHRENLKVPVRADWIDFSDVLSPLDDQCAHDAIQSFIFESRRKRQPVFRPRYARHGWFHSTVEWMKLQLSSKGFGVMQQVRQIRYSYRSTVIQAETSKGLVYLKCSPHFVNEASVCQCLGDLLPKYVEAPIATDFDRGLVLMRDYGEILAPITMKSQEEGVQWMEELAEFHQKTIGREQLLKDAGLRLMTPEVLERELEPLLRFCQQFKIAGDGVIEQIRQLSPAIKCDCKAVKDIGIPATLVHGDIYVSNVYRSRRTEAYHGVMDWGAS